MKKTPRDFAREALDRDDPTMWPLYTIVDMQMQSKRAVNDAKRTISLALEAEWYNGNIDGPAYYRLCIGLGLEPNPTATVEAGRVKGLARL